MTGLFFGVLWVIVACFISCFCVWLFDLDEFQEGFVITACLVGWPLVLFLIAVWCFFKWARHP